MWVTCSQNACSPSGPQRLVAWSKTALKGQGFSGIDCLKCHNIGWWWGKWGWKMILSKKLIWITPFYVQSEWVVEYEW